MKEETNVTGAMSARQITMTALFVALVAVGAFIKIPIPYLPFTLQLLFTTLAGLILGSRLGGMSVLMYLILGLAGIPIFTEGGGLMYVVKPTFGYLLGFAIGAFVAGRMVETSVTLTFKRLLAASFVNLAIVYGVGMIYLYEIKRFILSKTNWTRCIIYLLFCITSDTRYFPLYLGSSDCKTITSDFKTIVYITDVT